MPHPVTIDDDALRAAFEARASGGASSETQPPGAGAAPESEVGKGWGVESKLAAAFICRKVAPNWNIPADTEQGLAESLQDCADSLMPGGLANFEAWGPWGKLLFAAVAVGVSGVDLETFTIKPLKKEPIDVNSTRTDAPPTHTATPGGRFTTG